MSKSISGNQKHLTLSDCCFIEQALLQGLNFRQMAITLEKDPSTISKEIRLHRNMPRKNSSGKNDCIYAPKCDIYHICGNDTCMKSCWFCNNKNCHDYCWNYKPFKCKRIDKTPFVCNGCPLTLSCKHPHYFYSARLADSQYRKTLVSSRAGINCSPEELQNLDNLVSPLILKGQPQGISMLHMRMRSPVQEELYIHIWISVC